MDMVAMSLRSKSPTSTQVPFSRCKKIAVKRNSNRSLISSKMHTAFLRRTSSSFQKLKVQASEENKEDSSASASNETGKELETVKNDFDFSSFAPSAGLLLVWAGLTAYAFLLSPNQTPVHHFPSNYFLQWLLYYRYLISSLSFLFYFSTVICTF